MTLKEKLIKIENAAPLLGEPACQVVHELIAIIRKAIEQRDRYVPEGIVELVLDPELLKAGGG